MDHSHWAEQIDRHKRESQLCVGAIDTESIVRIAGTLVVAFRSGRKLLIAGNGGSAADALHLASEFVNRLTSDFERPAMPAIALVCDPAVVTSIANDTGYDQVFARQVEALGVPGDVLMLISTSGNSLNCIAAAQTASARGVVTIAVTGGTGGELANLASDTFLSPSSVTAHIQEAHLVFYHLLVHIVEREMYPAA